MARVTTLPMEMVISRGQGIRSAMLILRACHAQGFVAPSFATQREKRTRGGFGLDLSKYDPTKMGVRYCNEEEFDEDSEDEPLTGPSVNEQVQYNVLADECLMVDATPEEIQYSQRNELWHGTGSNHKCKQPGGRTLLFFQNPKKQQLYGVAEVRSGGAVKWLAKGAVVKGNVPEPLQGMKNGDRISPEKELRAFAKLSPEKKKVDGKYSGAVVLKIMHGLWMVPVWVRHLSGAFYSPRCQTLDFSSLYPTAMIAHNLSPDTCLSQEDIARYKLTVDDYELTPTGGYFVKPHIRKGLVCSELERVMAAREVSKGKVKATKAAGQMDMMEVHDSDQNAYKVLANGTYGYFGALTALYYFVVVAATTTAYGRDAIMLVVHALEGEFELPADICPNGERPVIIGTSCWFAANKNHSSAIRRRYRQCIRHLAKHHGSAACRPAGRGSRQVGVG
jgi:hypothetical protein